MGRNGQYEDPVVLRRTKGTVSRAVPSPVVAKVLAGRTGQETNMNNLGIRKMNVFAIIISARIFTVWSVTNFFLNTSLFFTTLKN